ncbi:MAG: O-antigen ligase family protein [Candidatus Gracilibacteria bacterium]
MRKKTVLLLSLIWLSALIFNPFGANIFELPKLVFLSVFLSLAILVFAFRYFSNQKLTIKSNKWLWILLGLWLASLASSTILSVAPELSFFGSYERLQGLYSQLIYVGLFLFIFNCLDDKKDQKVFLNSLLLISVIISIYAILQKVGLDFFDAGITRSSGLFGRSFATLGQPDFLGQFLLFPIWLSLGFAFTEKKKAIYVVSIILLILALIFTRNRASMLGLLLGAIFFVFYFLPLKKSARFLLALALVVAFSAFIFFIAPELRSLLSRFYIWQGAFALFPSHPLFGFGPETFSIVFQKVANPALFSLENFNQIADRAHNEYLDILLNQGLFGLSIYLTTIISTLSLLLKKKSSPYLVAALISILISIFFSFSLTVHWLILFTIIALALNQNVKFHLLKIKRKISTTIIILMISILAIANIFFVSRAFVADMYLDSGMTTLLKESDKSAIATIEYAAKLHPFQGEIYLRLGQAYLALSEFQLAEENLSRYGKFTNYDFKYYYFMGLIKRAEGDNTSAQKYFLEAKSLAPTNPLILQQAM